MAAIREEISLIDRFSNVFDKFINMGGRAANQAAMVEAATNRMASASTVAAQTMARASSAGNSSMWTPKLGNYDPGLMKEMYGTEELVKMGYMSANALKAEAAAAADAAAKMAAVNATRSSDAIDRMSKATGQATNSMGFYKKQIDTVDASINKLAGKMQLAQMAERRNPGTMQKDLDAMISKSQTLVGVRSNLNQKMLEMNPALNSAVKSTHTMETSFSNIASKVIAITALLGGITAAKQFIDLGFKTDQYERMLQARFGNADVGSAAFQHYHNMANQYGFKQEDVFQGVSSFMGMTTVPKQLDDLTMLAKTMAVFDTQGQGLKGAQFSLQEAMAGNFTSLHRRFSIGTSQIKSSGVEDAAKSGDMTKFIAGMQKLLEMRNMGGEAFNNLMKSPQRQLESFENRWHNTMSSMAQATVLRLLPALSKLSDFLASPMGEQFMNALAAGIGIAVAAVLWLVDGFFYLLQILQPLEPALEVIFWTLLIAGAYMAAAALWAMIPPLAIQLSAWMIMNAPILAVIGVIVILLMLFLKFPEVFGLVAGGIAQLGAIIWNIIVGICNQITGLFNLVISGINKISGSNFALTPQINYINPTDAFAAGKNWGTGFAKNAGDYLSGLKLPNLGGPTTAFDNFQGKDMGDPNIGKVGKVGKVGKIEQPVKLSDEDLKMLLDISDRDYVNKINLTQLTPNIHVQVDTGGGNVDADGVAEHIKHMLIEQAASSADLTYGG